MKTKTVFVCSECGYSSAKWYGKCPGCGEWNTLIEQVDAPKKASVQVRSAPRGEVLGLKQIDTADEVRFDTGLSELNRVLGGGAVRGSLVLVGGEPGIGKSTILLQICTHLCKEKSVLYVSGEESKRQLKLRADRLGVTGESLMVYSETDIEDIVETARAKKPDVVIVDSIQTVYRADISSAPGSVAQVRECTLALMALAKGEEITVFVVGHVNKEGAIAGPKVLEHMVDCVLYFEGDRSMSYRVLRAAKNRFGSTNEIGVFEMYDKGLREVGNPSAALLDGRPQGVPGTCVACVMEGSRPILSEVQALVTTSGFGNARRMSTGVDYNRAMLLLAVLEKRAGYKMSSCDVYINVVGGLKMEETAADLATVLALASSAKDSPISDTVAAFGEVGLTGELRAVSAAQLRVNEIARLGFTVCVLPAQNAREVTPPDGLQLLAAKNVREAIAALV